MIPNTGQEKEKDNLAFFSWDDALSWNIFLIGLAVGLATYVSIILNNFGL